MLITEPEQVSLSKLKPKNKNTKSSPGYWAHKIPHLQIAV